jgi:integrase
MIAPQNDTSVNAGSPEPIHCEIGPTPHFILCNQLQNAAADRVAFYLDASRARATHRAYAADLAAFAAWGGTIPASPEAVAAYLATSESLAVSTLRRRLAAIADAHLVGGHPDPTKNPLVRKVLRGIMRIRGLDATPPMPLDGAMLANLTASMPHDLPGIRDRALLLVGFFCALRRSELVGLMVEDLQSSPDSVMVNIQRSKTDQCAVGRWLGLPTQSGSLCPVSALRTWLEAACITSGPIFRTIDTAGRVKSRPFRHSRSALSYANVQPLLESTESRYRHIH